MSPRTVASPTAAGPRLARPRPNRARLAVVPAARDRGAKTPFVLLMVVVLSAGLVALLMLNTLLARGSFAVDGLEERVSRLQAEQQELQRELTLRATPESLAAAARDLGMVPVTDPAFLRLPDGKVIGDLDPVAEPVAPAADSGQPDPAADSRKQTRAEDEQTRADDEPSRRPSRRPAQRGGETVVDSEPGSPDAGQAGTRIIRGGGSGR